MEILREIVVYVHLIGFAVLFGSWAVQAFGGGRRLTTTMDVGLAIAGVAGLLLAWPMGLFEPGMSFYMKIAVKLVVLVIIGAFIGIGGARQKREQAVPPVLFWGVGVLALLNAARSEERRVGKECRSPGAT